jgi:glyoxylate reductase
MKKALFSEAELSNEQEKQLLDVGVELKYISGNLSEDQIIGELQGCDIHIIGGSERDTEKVINSTNLELIVFWGTGYQGAIDLDAASSRNVAVANTPHANAYTVAEHTIAMIVDAVKNVTFLNSDVKNGNWNRRQTWNLENKALGIVGLGAIGGSVAKIMRNAFNMNILYAERERNIVLEKELGAKKVELNELMSLSDVISIHVPLNDETKFMIGKSELKLVKQHTVLVNCARAGIVDPEALKNALTKNKLAAAAFDGYYEEPAPAKENDKYGLLSLPDNKFLITPHTAYSSKEAIENMNNMVVENILSHLKTGTPKYKVN